MPRKTTTAPAAKRGDAILDKYKDFAGIQVLERRFTSPNMPGSLPIRLLDEPAYLDDPLGKQRIWHLRWINGTVDGRTSQVTDALGYVPVQVDELRNAAAITGLSKSDDGIVRRGDKGQEWLAKMPLELYNEVKRRQRESVNRRTRNARQLREDLANAAGAGLGDEAGETIHRGLSVEVRTHRTTLGEEFDSVGADE